MFAKATCAVMSMPLFARYCEARAVCRQGSPGSPECFDATLGLAACGFMDCLGMIHASLHRQSTRKQARADCREAPSAGMRDLPGTPVSRRLKAEVLERFRHKEGPLRSLARVPTARPVRAR